MHMKKEYMSPLATEANIASEAMLATSNPTMRMSDETVDTSEAQLSGGRRGGSIWGE